MPSLDPEDAFSIISIVEAMRNLRGGARRVSSQENHAISSYYKELRRISQPRKIDCDYLHKLFDSNGSPIRYSDERQGRR